MAACFSLVSPLDFKEQEHKEEQEQDAKRVPDGHGQSFGSRPRQKQETAQSVISHLI